MFKVEMKKGIKVRHKVNGGFNANLMCLLLALDPPLSRRMTLGVRVDDFRIPPGTRAKLYGLIHYFNKFINVPGRTKKWHNPSFQ